MENSAYLPPINSYQDIKVGQVWKNLTGEMANGELVVLTDITLTPNNMTYKAKLFSDPESSEEIPIPPSALFHADKWIQLNLESKVAPAILVKSAEPTPVTKAVEVIPTKTVVEGAKSMRNTTRQKPLRKEVVIDKKKIKLTQAPFSEISKAGLKMGEKPTEKLPVPDEIRVGQVYLTAKHRWEGRVVVCPKDENGNARVLSVDENGKFYGKLVTSVDPKYLRRHKNYVLVYDPEQQMEAPQQVLNLTQEADAPEEISVATPAPSIEFDALVSLDGDTQVDSPEVATWSFTYEAEGKKARIGATSSNEIAIWMPSDQAWISRHMDKIQSAVIQLSALHSTEVEAVS